MARLGRGIVLVILVLGSACRPSARQARFAFLGHAAFGTPYADSRRLSESCPACGTAASEQPGSCEGKGPEGKPCGVRIGRPASVPCGFCERTGACAVCALFGSGGRCRHCLGRGTLGAGTTCFNCDGKGVCAACGGTAACDACGGTSSLKLPWSPSTAKLPAAPPGAAAAPPRADPPVCVPGTPVQWSGAPEWTVFELDSGRRREVDRVLGDPARYVPRVAGFYLAVAPGAGVVFDVLDARLPVGASPGSGAPPVSVVPALRSAPARWEGDPTKDPAVVVELPGLGPRTLAVPVLAKVSELRVQPALLPVRAGAPARFEVEAVPPLGPNVACEWTVREGDAPPQVVSARGPVFEHLFERAGRWRVEVRVGAVSSKPVEVPVYRVAVVDALDRPLQEVRMPALRREAFSEGRLREEAVLAAPERVRILVEDPDPSAPASLRILTRSVEEGLVSPPVEYALGGAGAGRVTRPFLLLPDRDDAGGEPTGEDSALHAVARGRIEVVYRGLSAGGAGVGPLIAHEILVRFAAAGPGLPPDEDLARALDRRLAQANSVWEPRGRRFRRAALSRFEAVEGALLIRGRAAGADAQGRPSRAGALLDGREWAVPTPWREESGPTTPFAAASALLEQAPGRRVDRHEKLVAGDPEAVLLRVFRPDGTPARIEPLPGEGDIAQSCGPLRVELRDGCEVASVPGRLSLEELGTVIAGRSGSIEGIDVVVVKELRSLRARPAYKVYPVRHGLPPALAGAVLCSWRLLDSGDRHPYGFARALGELLLPPGLKPGPEDTLFMDPLSEEGGVDANKRISAATALRLLERGRAATDRK